MIIAQTFNRKIEKTQKNILKYETSDTLYLVLRVARIHSSGRKRDGRI